MNTEKEKFKAKVHKVYIDGSNQDLTGGFRIACMKIAKTTHPGFPEGKHGGAFIL